jgi:hypothetical protein
MQRVLQFVFFSLICACLASCDDKPAQQIVDQVVETHGGSAYESFLLEFDFRKRHYTAARNQGLFTYTREFTDSTGRIKDVLDNEGFRRFRNGTLVQIPDERKQAFSRSVNSVIYFVLLPFGLNDKPVNKELITETTIRGEPYNVVRVTFDQRGGEDHQDVFLYWFHKQKHTMDYFAYSYKVDGGGIRFREAINPRVKGGIRWQDYINYKPQDESVPLDSLQNMFISGRLEKLSDIVMENVVVTDYKNPD